MHTPLPSWVTCGPRPGKNFRSQPDPPFGLTITSLVAASQSRDTKFNGEGCTFMSPLFYAATIRRGNAQCLAKFP